MQDRDLVFALAGLLHDIGKFAQRAGVGGTRFWDKQAEQDFKYRHALLTNDFIEKYVPNQWAVLIKPLAANHHRPNNDDERLIRLADQLSAGERASSGDQGVDDRRVHPKQLQSIFCSITAEGYRTPETLYMPLKPLEMNRHVIFPGNAWDEQRVWSAYEALWESFCEEAKLLKSVHESGGDLQTYLEDMLSLLQHYTWCIPSAYFKAIPDVSLYDHGRITAALSVCLPQTILADDTSDVPAALLVAGDISGVQNFIYTITSRGAASALRGRSLYLELLTEAIARYLLRQLKLPVTNLVQVGGGHFYLLARPSDVERIEQVKRQVAQNLLSYHRGDLYLALDYITLIPRDFQGKALSGKWSDVSEQLRHVKSRKFSELGSEMYSQIFDPKFDVGNIEKECQVCGREHEGTLKLEEGTLREKRKCPQCLGFEELGDLLRQARFMRLSESDITTQPETVTAPGDWKASLMSFGMVAELFESVPETRMDTERSVLYALDDEGLRKIKPAKSVAIGRRFLVNVTPILTKEERNELTKHIDESDLPPAGSVKPFEVMELQSKGGFKRLGVLRLDMDNAGALFRDGFGEYATFSRIASLSFMISLFYEGWIAELARKYNRQGASPQDRVYSIYSGGDDLFLLGSWDAIPNLALDIHRDLVEFVANHPGIHSSAGIVLVGGKYPLYQAAEDAGEALQAAKAVQGKNAITFLSQSLPWQTFMMQVKPYMEVMYTWVTEKGVPRNILQQMQQFQLLYLNKARQMKDRGEIYNKTGKQAIFWGQWNWRAAYFLKRTALRTKVEEIDTLRKDLGGENFRAIEWIGLAARWADLLTR